MNRLLERRRAMMMDVGEIKGTSIFYCNGYDHNDYQWDSSSNLSLLNNAPSTATNYARINKSGSGTEGWIYTTFDASSLLSNATVVYANITIKGFSNTGGTKTVQPYCNGVAKYSPITTGNSSDLYRTIIVSKLTIEDIKGLTCKFYMVSSTTSVYYRIYGATLRVVWSTNPEYFHFQDPEVESVIADKIGNGVGITLDAMQLVTSLPVDTFRGNTDIVTFNEFKYFTGLTTITAGSSTSATGAFGGCTALTSIEIPNSITTIGAYAFYNCSNLKNLIIPSTVTSIGNYAFCNLVKLKELEIPIGINLFVFKAGEASGVGSAGCYEGDLIIHGNVTSSNYIAGTVTLKFNKVVVYGSFNLTGSSGNLRKVGGTANFYIRDGLNIITNATTSSIFTGARNFLSIGGNITAAGSNSRLTNSTVSALHLGRSSVITATPTQMSIGYITNIYVGDGSSKSSDEAVLALYLADTNWSGQSAKLATWWDYNGTYKWYYVTDNLTNCTNTNPDAWPHITRGDSYHTQIVADEGYTLSSVQVHMYQCEDNTATPNTPTDITSQVYDSSTGEINIEHVVGNVIITATAS